MKRTLFLLLTFILIKQTYASSIHEEKLDEPLLKPTVSSCSKVQQLSALFTYNIEHFSFFKQFEADKVAIDITQSPYLQMNLAENFLLTDGEEFLNVAEGYHQQGLISSTKLSLIKSAYKSGFGFDNLRYSTTNSVLSTKYPGIFGDLEKYKGSLLEVYLNTVSASYRELRDNWRYKDYLTAELPLFFSETWISLSAQSYFSMASAVQGLINTEDANYKLNRVCSLLLLQRSYAQLIKIKGHYSPLIDVSDFPKISELHKSRQPQFEVQPVVGSFISTNGENKVLSLNEVLNYDPYKEKLSLVEYVPTKDIARQDATLIERIAFLQALVNFYQATSPASPWVKDIDSYYLGAVEDYSSGILPYEAHTLNLGLILMTLKNLYYDSIHAVNSKYALQKNNEVANEIMIARLKKETEVKRVRLIDVIKFAKTIVRLDHAMDHFKRRAFNEWASYHPLYTKDYLTSLFGETQKSYPMPLVSKLNELQMPLLRLIDKFIVGECTSIADWNVKTGAFKRLTQCSDEIKTSALMVKELILKHNGNI